MLEHYWYIACAESSLAKGPHAFQAFDQHLVAFRTEDGTVAVLVDRCAHRNAPLSAGFIDGQLLRCPYHGWGYSSQGVAEHIPARPAHDHAIRKPCIQSYPALIQDGYVWFALSDKPATATPVPFAHYSEPGWTSFRMNTLFEGPVESCLENFLDCPHATFVHNLWFRKPTAKQLRADVQVTDDGAVATYHDEPREGSVVWTLLSKKQSTMQHTDRFIAPATTKVDYLFSDNRHYIITSSCTPESSDRTRVHTVITFKFGPIAWFIRLFFEPLSRWIIYQDVKIVALQQQNIKRFGGKRYNIIDQDLLFKHIAQWRHAMQNNADTPAPTDVETIELLL